MATAKRLNDTQLRLIQMFGYASTPAQEKELMEVLSNYYLKKFNEGKKQLEKEGKLDSKKIDAYLATHHHGKRIKA